MDDRKTAERFSKQAKVRILLLAIIIAVLATLFGIYFSFVLNISTGGSIVVVTLLFFLASLLTRHSAT